MSNELTIFEGQELEILTKDDVNFEFEGTVLFNGKQVSKILGYADNCTTKESERVNLSKAITNNIDEESRFLVTKESFRNLGGYENYTIGNRGEVFINEDGVFDLIYNSLLPQAKQFKKKVKAIISQIQRTGKFDSTENNIMLIEDETERNLTLTIYNLKQTLTNNPNDMLMQFAYNSKVTDLTTYKQSKMLALIQSQVDDIKADTELIKGQQLYICDRTNFSEKMVILANKYFGRDKSKAYNALFGKMKTLGSFDVYQRRKNEWDKINEERVAEGKDPYKPSTLKGKVNYLDIIDKNGRWELCSEAYKIIETDEYTSNTAR